MHETPTHELLSAYLDGELSGDEHALVERLLVDQSEARHLLEELRALRSGLEAVPRYRLEADFAQKVLRRAEREMLSPQGAIAAAEVHRSPAENARVADNLRTVTVVALPPAESPMSPPWWPRLRRPLVYAGLALAAGLLIMVVARDPLADRIARAPEARPNAARDAAQADARPERAAASRHEALVREKRNLTAPSPAERNGESRVDSKGGAEAAGAPAVPTAPRSAVAKDDSRSDRNRRGQSLATGAAADPSPSQSRTSKAGPMDELALEQEPHDGLLVIVADVDASSGYGTVFNELLARQNIFVEPADEGAAADGAEADQDRLDSTDHAAKAKADTRLERAPIEPGGGTQLEIEQQALQEVLRELDREPEGRGAVGGALRGGALRGGVPAGPMVPQDVVYVEATEEQLQATLAELGQQSELFFNLRQVQHAENGQIPGLADTISGAPVEEPADKPDLKTRRRLGKKPQAPVAAGAREPPRSRDQRKKLSEPLGRALRLKVPTDSLAETESIELKQQQAPAPDASLPSQSSQAPGEPSEEAEVADRQDSEPAYYRAMFVFRQVDSGPDDAASPVEPADSQPAEPPPDE